MRVNQNTKIFNGQYSLLQLLIPYSLRFKESKSPATSFAVDEKGMKFDFSIFKESLLAQSQV